MFDYIHVHLWEQKDEAVLIGQNSLKVEGDVKEGDVVVPGRISY